MGIAEYDANTTYYANSICQISGQVYISLVDNNLDNAPSTSPTQWQAGLPGAEITGVVKSFAGVVAPYGYLLCDGSAYSRTSYAALFAICGTNYGAGNGSTTFNVPDLRTRVPVGYKSGDSNFGTVGQVGGEEEHTLVVTEIPSHTHTVNGDTNAPHTPYAGFGHQAQSSSPVDSTGSTGGDGAHNNLQPYVTMNYIIKT
jgi:microcystin-dependent protein